MRKSSLFVEQNVLFDEHDYQHPGGQAAFVFRGDVQLLFADPQLTNHGQLTGNRMDGKLHSALRQPIRDGRSGGIGVFGVHRQYRRSGLYRLGHPHDRGSGRVVQPVRYQIVAKRDRHVRPRTRGGPQLVLGVNGYALENGNVVVYVRYAYRQLSFGRQVAPVRGDDLQTVHALHFPVDQRFRNDHVSGFLVDGEHFTAWNQNQIIV